MQSVIDLADDGQIVEAQNRLAFLHLSRNALSGHDRQICENAIEKAKEREAVGGGDDDQGEDDNDQGEDEQ